MPITTNKTTLKSNTPHIVVGTPGRILGLLRSKDLKLDKLKHYVLDECDRMLEALGESARRLPSLLVAHRLTAAASTPWNASSELIARPRIAFLCPLRPSFPRRRFARGSADMRKDVQEIFRATPHQKQVMMFTATMSKEIRPVCKKFCQDVKKPTKSAAAPCPALQP